MRFDLYRLTDKIVMISEYSDCLPIVLFLIYPIFIGRYRWFFMYLIAFQFLHFISIYTGLQGTNNMWVYKLIGATELTFLYIFYSRYVKSLVIRSLFWVTMGFYIHYSFFMVGKNEINPLGLGVSVLFLLILTFNYLLYIYRSESVIVLSKSFVFWINTALMIYLSCSFFAYLFSFQTLFVSQDFDDLFKYSWALHSIGNILKCLIVSVGLVWCRKSLELEMSS